MNKKLTSVTNFIKKNPVPTIYAASVVVCVGTFVYLQKSTSLNMNETFLNVTNRHAQHMAETGDLMLFSGEKYDFLVKLTPKS